MARKNLLTRLTAAEPVSAPSEARSDYARRGASRSMMLSIDEMAENAKRMAAGEAIVELETDLIDRSFVADRIAEDDEDYAALHTAIREQGQTTPILVRPHPERAGRYMIVFGHRRVRVARELGIPVRAVVKPIEDIAHIVAQGQENTARANLSFIEKALFAQKLLAMGQTKETIKAALTVDDTLLSRMLAVAEGVPRQVIEAIGAAKGIGRDRWEGLKKLVLPPANAERAKQFVASEQFASAEPEKRLDVLVAHLKTAPARRRKPETAARASSWVPEDKRVSAIFKSTGRSFDLTLKAKDASAFGEFISANLDALYRAFRDARDFKPGD